MVSKPEMLVEPHGAIVLMLVTVSDEPIRSRRVRSAWMELSIRRGRCRWPW